ncbi:uncharacterized protein TM35_000261220, partial [Trypanosoma theileri]
LKLLLPLCKRWSVRVPPRSDSVGEDTYSNDLIQRLALKVGRVMERKLSVGEDDVVLFSPVSPVLSFGFSGCLFSEDKPGFDGCSFCPRTSVTQIPCADTSCTAEELCSKTADSIVTIFAQSYV